MAETRAQFGNPKDGECPPFEAVTSRTAKTQLIEKT
jgi:hypothetical protein